MIALLTDFRKVWVRSFGGSSSGGIKSHLGLADSRCPRVRFLRNLGDLKCIKEFQSEC